MFNFFKKGSKSDKDTLLDNMEDEEEEKRREERELEKQKEKEKEEERKRQKEKERMLEERNKVFHPSTSR